MNKRKKILLAEDDHNLGYVLSEYLKMHSYEVSYAKDGTEALKIFNNESFNICILDIMMPKLDGFSVAKNIRIKNREIPIIFLTAKHLKVDKLKAFKIGADDYINKPVDEEELIARIEAILRRTETIKVNKKQEIFNIGKTIFDFKNQKLVFNDDIKKLTTKESEILLELCINKGSVISRQVILNRYWGQNDYFSRKSMDVFIYKLRKHLSPNKAISIRNIHGKGFILEVD
ncbi:response regulator transcription factor [Psychroserpens algicola]|uniref:Response regulator transcription factor n=1 Tax=Psychroserpens algicola TaxID=1719034 RepID=A0ABT0H5Y6_9FLAO|nr:response regulator transcription factor [Psychroserpens algicola]MCK8479788.1 response regulator transcription factor [Psychroserpens algicola]